MAVDLRIAGGIVCTASGCDRLDVLVDGETIVALISPGLEISDVEKTIDASGKLVIPGMIDPHVHTREPGFTHKEDIETTTRQAAAGGVTTIFGMPNLKPPTSTVETLDDVLSRYAATSIVDYNHNPAAIFPEHIAPMAERGIRAFKVYMVVDTEREYPHPLGTGMHDHGDILRMMDLIAPTGLPFIIHPHDQGLMNYIQAEFLDGGQNTPAGYAQAFAAREGVIWDTSCDTLIRLSEASGCPIHLAHMQTRRSIDAVRRAKERGLRITCEVNHWTLFLGTWDHIERLGPYALSYWVCDDARDAIWEGIGDGTIDMLSSDHAPHTRQEKDIGWTAMWSAHTGTPGIQYQLPLLLDAVLENRLSLDRAVNLVAGRPSEVFGLDHVKGTISPGWHADVAVIEPNAPWKITEGGVLSKCGWTPYEGVESKHRIDQVFLRGQEVFANGVVSGSPGQGRLARASDELALAMS